MDSSSVENIGLITAASINDSMNTTGIAEEISLSERFAKSTLRFSVYTTIRSLEVVFGIYGNILTLIIMKRLKYRSNGHILMIYLAVSDIILSCTFPITCYLFATETLLEKGSNWSWFCKIKEYLAFNSTAACMLGYVLLSVDR